MNCIGIISGPREEAAVCYMKMLHRAPRDHLGPRGEQLDNVSAAPRLQLTAHRSAAVWPELPNAGLTNHRLSARDVWRCRRGLLTSTSAKILWTRRDHRDCVLDFEFKRKPGTAGGVFLRNSNAEKWPAAAINIQISDDGLALTGAFVGDQASSGDAAKPSGEWSRLTVSCQGPRLTVVLNGEVVNEIDLTRRTIGTKNPDEFAGPAELQGRPRLAPSVKVCVGFQHVAAGRRHRIPRSKTPPPRSAHAGSVK